MDLPIGSNLFDRIKRRRDAELSVVRQAEVAIIRGRVLPRNNKDDETLLSKVSNQRVFGREYRGCNTSLSMPGRSGLVRQKPFS